MVFDSLLIQDRLKECYDARWRGDLVDVSPDSIARVPTGGERGLLNNGLVIEADEVRENKMNVLGIHADPR